MQAINRTSCAVRQDQDVVGDVGTECWRYLDRIGALVRTQVTLVSISAPISTAISSFSWQAGTCGGHSSPPRHATLPNSSSPQTSPGEREICQTNNSSQVVFTLQSARARPGPGPGCLSLLAAGQGRAACADHRGMNNIIMRGRQEIRIQTQRG